MNGEESDFFITTSGLRQGDPFSPLLFNLVVDVFAKMVIKGSQAGLIRGLCPNFHPGAVTCLQYAADTLPFVDNDHRAAINLKWAMTCFQLISGMSINYHKSELVPINLEEAEIQAFLDISIVLRGNSLSNIWGFPCILIN